MINRQFSTPLVTLHFVWLSPDCAGADATQNIERETLKEERSNKKKATECQNINSFFFFFFVIIAKAAGIYIQYTHTLSPIYLSAIKTKSWAKNENYTF